MTEPNRKLAEDDGIPAVADDESMAEDSGVRRPFSDDEVTLPVGDSDASRRWGTTVAEARAGEPLARRLLAERPDVLPPDEDDAVGRLAEQDGAGLISGPDAGTASDTRERDGLSAEEAAMYLVPDTDEESWEWEARDVTDQPPDE